MIDEVKDEVKDEVDKQQKQDEEQDKEDKVKKDKEDKELRYKNIIIKQNQIKLNQSCIYWVYLSHIEFPHQYHRIHVVYYMM